MLVKACPFRRQCPTHISAALRNCAPLRIQQRCFQASRRLRDDFQNHYETLGVPPAASEKEVKKSFYALSKSHHPDLHPNDPDASKRFVRISEAYAVLSSPTKRATYDRDLQRTQQASHPSPAYPSGSFSSASTPAGGRPASGLSRRRTRFQGPPPSFYQSGGWGAQGAKRSEYASKPSHAWETAAGGGGQEMPGTGPGGFAYGMDNDVSHFDSRGHYQTHSTIERTRHRTRRRQQAEDEFNAVVGASGSVVVGFFLIAGILAATFGVTKFLIGTVPRPTKAGSVETDRR